MDVVCGLRKDKHLLRDGRVDRCGGVLPNHAQRIGAALKGGGLTDGIHRGYNTLKVLGGGVRVQVSLRRPRFHDVEASLGQLGSEKL
eukprot:scaffold3453_cov253-Pinguiococcus_pyrenoidosus.AAC.1